MLEQTELTAVNKLLRAIGDVPVNVLSDPNPDVVAARDTLADHVAETLLVGWWFNEDHGLTLFPDADNIITIPPNTLSVDPTDVNSPYVRKQNKLYDTEKQTFYITEPVPVEIVYYVELDDMPYAAYNAVVASAAREFAANMEADATQLANLEKDETRAWRMLARIELKNRDVNILTSPRAMMFLKGMPRRYRRSVK